MRPRIAVAAHIDYAEPDDLFTLSTHTCTDCGQAFESSRPAHRCAMCTALRSGDVGPATVVCPGCGAEHKVPILADHKLCGPCRADLVLTKMALESTLNAAQCRADEAWLRLDADLAHADAADRARYDAAMERAAEWGAERWQRARDAAIAKADGLSPLLAARRAWDEAAAALDQVRSDVQLGLEEVERATT
jgi:hypothetical protein